jgi:putative transposase
MAEENRRLKKMYAEMAMQNELLKDALGKNVWSAPSLQGISGIV